MALRLTNCTLIELDPPSARVGEVLIEGDRIVESTRQEVVVLDLGGAWVMPGLVVAHHHLYSALACGMPGPATAPTGFSDMLDKVWWRMDKALDEESVHACGLVGGLGCLRAGVTTVIDHHSAPNCPDLAPLDEALSTIGIRRVLAMEVSDRDGKQKELLACHRWALDRRNAWRGVLIGAHANFTLSDETLRAIGGLAREARVGVHIHVGESEEDVLPDGEPLIRRMQRLDALPANSVLAHGVHLPLEALGQVEGARAWLTHQPRSNMNNGVGHADIAHFPTTSALGTDGIGADLFAEAQTGFFRANEAGADVSPRRWAQMMAGGARIAGRSLGVMLGRLQNGYAADLVVLDPPPGPRLNDDNVAAALLFRLSTAAVRRVMVAGEWRAPDPQPIDELAQVAAERLWQAM